MSLTVLATSLGLKRPRGFHTYWTAPHGPLNFRDYELITWILGPLIFRERTRGEFWLYTDEKGYEHVLKLGLQILYDRIEFISPTVAHAVDPKMFWAAGKIDAYKRIPLPAISLDMDAIIWNSFWHFKFAAVIALNQEPTDWQCYRNNQSRWEGLLDDIKLDWNIPASNAGVLAFFDEEFRKEYCYIAEGFMYDVSRKEKPVLYQDVGRPTSGVFFEEQVFAEQRLLGLVAARMKKRLVHVTEFDRHLDHCLDNPYVTHLWKSKAGYFKNPNAAANYVQSMLTILWENFRDYWPLVYKLGLPSTVIEDFNANNLRFGSEHDWNVPGEKKHI